MKIIYYYSFLFYKKNLKDDTPYSTTIWALGLAEGFFVSVILNLLVIHFFCINMGKWFMIAIGVICLLINYLYFTKDGRSKKIIKQQPVFLGSPKISILVTTLFYIILISSLFWGPVYAKHLLTVNCRYL